jgi:hypothetical protein
MRMQDPEWGRIRNNVLRFSSSLLLSSLELSDAEVYEL